MFNNHSRGSTTSNTFSFIKNVTIRIKKASLFENQNIYLGISQEMYPYYI